jgi:stage V sporulation protein SpoVS
MLPDNFGNQVDASFRIEENNNKFVFWVSRKNNVKTSSSALLGFLKEQKEVEINAVGANALNQAFKIVVNARAELARSGKELITKLGMKSRQGIKPGEGLISVCVIRFEIR